MLAKGEVPSVAVEEAVGSSWDGSGGIGTAAAVAAADVVSWPDGDESDDDGGGGGDDGDGDGGDDDANDAAAAAAAAAAAVAATSASLLLGVSTPRSPTVSDGRRDCCLRFCSWATCLAFCCRRRRRWKSAKNAESSSGCWILTDMGSWLIEVMPDRSLYLPLRAEIVGLVGRDEWFPGVWLLLPPSPSPRSEAGAADTAAFSGMTMFSSGQFLLPAGSRAGR